MKTSTTYLAPVYPLDEELVLEHDEILLVTIVLDEPLEAHMKCIEEVGAVDDERFKEEADRFEACEDVLGGGSGKEGGKGEDALGECAGTRMWRRCNVSVICRAKTEGDKANRTFRLSQSHLSSEPRALATCRVTSFHTRSSISVSALSNHSP